MRVLREIEMVTTIDCLTGDLQSGSRLHRIVQQVFFGTVPMLNLPTVLAQTSATARLRRLTLCMAWRQHGMHTAPCIATPDAAPDVLLGCYRNIPSITEEAPRTVLTTPSRSLEFMVLVTGVHPGGLLDRTSCELHGQPSVYVHRQQRQRLPTTPSCMPCSCLTCLWSSWCALANPYTRTCLPTHAGSVSGSSCFVLKYRRTNLSVSMPMAQLVCDYQSIYADLVGHVR